MHLWCDETLPENARNKQFAGRYSGICDHCFLIWKNMMLQPDLSFSPGIEIDATKRLDQGNNSQVGLVDVDPEKQTSRI